MGTESTIPEMAPHIAGAIAANLGYTTCVAAIGYTQVTLARAGYHDAARDCASLLNLIAKARESAEGEPQCK